jgi:hypothetical protein
MVHRQQNWSFTDPPMANGDIADRCNCAQKYPGTSICNGVSGLQFIESNLVNCEVPADAVLVDCNNAQIDYCYWLHPDMGLPTESENCRHVVDIDTVIIDGQSQVDYQREDTVVS